MNQQTNNLWIINKKAYDLTPFFDSHPGGSYILKLNQGRDCTELFYSYHITTSKDVIGMLKKYYVREAETHEIKSQFNWDTPVLYNDFKERLQLWKRQSGNFLKATWFGLLTYLLLFLVGIINYYFWFLGYWITLPILAIVASHGSAELLHSATHYSVFKKASWNEWIAYLGIYHSLPLSWYHQHVIGHHSHTNIQGKDPDLDHFKSYRGLKIGWRTHTGQRYYEHYKKWRKILCLFAPLASWVPLTIRPIDIWRTGTYMKVLQFKYTSRREFWSYICQFIFTLAIPVLMMWNLGFLKGALFCIIPRILHGVGYYLVSQVNHITKAAFSRVQDNTTNEWIVHQILTSVDYSTQSEIARYLYDGLNNQVVHHIVPGAHPTHFAELNLLVRAFCTDHNINYVSYDSFQTALKKHLEYLEELNS